MRVDANVKDKMDLLAGVYAWEIINAKEIVRKKEPKRNQIVVEFLATSGPEYENGEPSEGHEHTEFIDLTFEGLEGKGLKFMEGKYQDFVKALGMTVVEFEAQEAEDLIGMKINGSGKISVYLGVPKFQIDSYSLYVE